MQDLFKYTLLGFCKSSNKEKEEQESSGKWLQSVNFIIRDVNTQTREMEACWLVGYQIPHSPAQKGGTPLNKMYRITPALQTSASGP